MVRRARKINASWGWRDYYDASQARSSVLTGGEAAAPALGLGPWQEARIINREGVISQRLELLGAADTINVEEDEIGIVLAIDGRDACSEWGIYLEAGAEV